jgi:hypothetical protein
VDFFHILTLLAVTSEASMSENIEKKKTASAGVIIAIIALLCVAAVAALGFEKLNQLEQTNAKLELALTESQSTVQDLQTKLAKLEEKTQEVVIDHFFRKLGNIVDFSVPNVQEIGNGFFVVKASQEEHLTGIKFNGRIINAQSVRHKNASFKLTVDGKSVDFSINQISPGNSTSFSVYVPELKAENARYAKIEYQSSSVEFYTR